MGTQVVLTLPDELYQRAKRWATITQRELPDILTEALSVVLRPMYTTPELDRPISALPDQQVVALCTLQMEPAQGQRLDRLLAKQSEGELIDRERSELLALMQVYERLWIRQSQALAEAVKRGLRGPLEP